MKVKTAELTECQLDWAVAKCEVPSMKWDDPTHFQHFLAMRGGHPIHQRWHFHEDWRDGGPIIEREKIDIGWERQAGPEAWRACLNANPLHFGPTALVAAMRCYVASKLGEEIDVPEELK